MRRRSMLSFASAVAIVTMGLAVTTASATRFRVSSQSIRAVWTSVVFEAAGASVQCNMTLEGTFASSTISKVSIVLMGRFGEARLGTCTGGVVTLLRETLPWHLTYQYFVGRLPGIDSIGKLGTGVAARIQPTGLPACLARTTIAEPMVLISALSAGRVTSVRVDESLGIDLEGGFACDLAGDGRLSGTGTVTTAAGAALTVTLI